MNAGMKNPGHCSATANAVAGTPIALFSMLSRPIPDGGSCGDFFLCLFFNARFFPSTPCPAAPRLLQSPQAA